MRFPMCHLLCIPGVGYGKAVSRWGRVGVGWKTPKLKPNNLELEENNDYVGFGHQQFRWSNN